MIGRWVVLVWLAAAFATSAGAATPMDDLVAPAAYNQLLEEYVVKRPLEGGGFETRFDYVALAGREDVAHAMTGLRDIFEAVDPGSLGEDARKAWAANAYNFFVIDLIVSNVEGKDAPSSISVLEGGDFKAFSRPRIKVGGEMLSLNDFELGYLFHDIDRGSGDVPEGLDPRLHFAIVCAARGCPSLWPEPFTARDLDAQLEAVTLNALQSPRQFRLGEDVAHASKIFEWYAADFAGGPAAFLARYVPGVTEDTPVVTDIEWDWSLNAP